MTAAFRHRQAQPRLPRDIGNWLMIVNWVTGLLYRVDPVTGFAMQVDLGGETLLSGDGILLDGRNTLYVVQSFANQIAEVDLECLATA